MGIGLEDITIVGAVLFGIGAIQLTLDCLSETYNPSLEEIGGFVKQTYKILTGNYKE